MFYLDRGARGFYFPPVVEVLLNPPSVIWPLCFLLGMLVIFRDIKQDVRPIFQNIVTGVAKNAGSNAQAYAIALGFGLSASLAAFIDVFHTLDSTTLSLISWHQYAALWAKIANPFIVAVLAYATQSKFPQGGDGAPTVK